MPKVLIGSPISDYHSYCTLQYLQGLKKLTYKDIDILLVDNSEKEDFYNKLKKLTNVKIIRAFNDIKDIKEKIVKSRNLILEYCLEKGYDYFFSLEQDVIPPKNVIERLLKCNKEIVSGVYFSEFETSQGKISSPLLYRLPTIEEENYIKENFEKVKKNFDDKTIKYLEANNYSIKDLEIPMTEEEVSFNYFMEVKMCGLGCLMIHKDVLNKVRFRIKPDDKAFDDYFFCMDARKNGFHIYADTSVKCLHLIKDRPWKWDEITSKK